MRGDSLLASLGRSSAPWISSITMPTISLAPLNSKSLFRLPRSRLTPTVGAPCPTAPTPTPCACADPVGFSAGPVSLPLLPPPPPPPLLELQLLPNFRLRSTLFPRSACFRASFFAPAPGDGGASCIPVPSTAGEPSTVSPSPEGVPPAEVSPENLRTKSLRGMNRDVALTAEWGVVGSANSAVGRGVSSTAIGVGVASDAPGVGVTGDDGRTCSSGRLNGGRGCGTDNALPDDVLLPGVPDTADVALASLAGGM